MTLRELYRQIVNTSVRSALVTGIELVLLEEPVLKLRAHMGHLVFVELFFVAHPSFRGPCEPPSLWGDII